MSNIIHFLFDHLFLPSRTLPTSILQNFQPQFSPNLISNPNFRFHSVAYLHQIWWFEVTGEITFSFPPGSYSLYFRLHLGRPSKRLGRKIWSTENVHGWDLKPVKFSLSTLDGQSSNSVYQLKEVDSWGVYYVGDFEVRDLEAEDLKVKYSMTQIDCTHTKGGLCVDCVLVYPKGFGLGNDKDNNLMVCV